MNEVGTAHTAARRIEWIAAVVQHRDHAQQQCLLPSARCSTHSRYGTDYRQWCPTDESGISAPLSTEAHTHQSTWGNESLL